MNPLSGREQRCFVDHFGARRLTYKAIAEELELSSDHVQYIVRWAARKIADELVRQEQLKREGRLVDPEAVESYWEAKKAGQL